MTQHNKIIQTSEQIPHASNDKESNYQSHVAQHNNWKDTGRPQIEYHILSIVRLSNIKDNATTYASASSASLQREDHLNKIYDFIDTLLIERTKAIAEFAQEYVRNYKFGNDNLLSEDIATQITKLIETEE